MHSLGRAYPGHDCHCRCGCTVDGGLGPALFDTEPANPPPRPSRHGTLRFGPPSRLAIAPDTVPTGGAVVAAKRLHQRRDRPWTSTATSREFSRPGYLAAGADPDTLGMEARAKDTGTKNSPMKLKPMKTGKWQHPLSAYPHMSHSVMRAPTAGGLSLKVGRGTGLFDPNIHSGGHMVSLPKTGIPDAPPPRPRSRPSDSRWRWGTFGGYPAHLPEPYSDNPLRDDPLQCRRPFKTQQTFGKPSMPVVNVWEAPAGLQTKAGVRSIADHPTGHPVTALTEVGRLGTTL